MIRFILGVIVGALASNWLQRGQNQEAVERRFAEMQERANVVLNESRRILEETRRELGAALEAGRRSVESRAERIRRAAEDTPEQSSPDQSEGPSGGETQSGGSGI